ncbi:hypothetical protein L1277_001119 [Okibacterium sp. HSC-33S16]|uniref:hypothetical protein n=1 Tax=Okibacterium sp. HSC-33S16 TaxID=2910965 RepID=UPI00209C7963|nr:hypothetical protein [Okibacterium sp. HSC-33S16]MCP2031028.1 hypothetical protein [Okibacterium sp. HSC-33S16]
MLNTDQVRGRLDLFLMGSAGSHRFILVTAIVVALPGSTKKVHPMFTPRGRLVLTAAAGALLVGAGVAALSTGAAASAPPSPSTFTVNVSTSCSLQRIGDQFVKCDNLTGAGVRAPAFIPLVVPTHVSGIQRIGSGDFR